MTIEFVTETRTVGTWRTMQFDAVTIVDGLAWRRAKDGFGGPDARHPREDWLLDLPGVTISVNRHLKGTVGKETRWRADFHGVGGFASLEEAMRAEVADALDRGRLEYTMNKAAAELGKVATARQLMREATNAA